LGAGAARTGPTNGDRGARQPNLAAASSGNGEPQEPVELVDKGRRGLLQNGPLAFSGHGRRRDDPHFHNVGAALHATRVALADLASCKGVGRNSSHNPSEGNSREENGRETNEHVGVGLRETMKDVEFLLASSVYTHLLYLERPLLCPPWGRQAPWKGTGLVVQW
jgi:hypothetical protein